MPINRTLDNTVGAFQPCFHMMPALLTGKQQRFLSPVQEQELFHKDQSEGDMYIGLLLKGIIHDTTTN